MNSKQAQRPLPTSINDYLAQLRQALAGADAAMIQDALYDAEEYLRAELAANRDSGNGRSEAEVIAEVAGSYGAPDEVADIYRDTEVTVNRALRPPVAPRRGSWLGRYFAVAADPQSYTAVFYLLLAMLSGVFYFTCIAVSFSLSLGLSITIVGLPMLVLSFGLLRLLALVEGRIVEVLLGMRMPRRPFHAEADGQRGLLARIGAMFTDVRSWSSLLYFMLLLPLGVIYFTVVVTLLSLSLSLIWSPLSLLTPWPLMMLLFGHDVVAEMSWLVVPMAVLGALLAVASLHLARAAGNLHARLAKRMLVVAAG
jgi:uncharacterized membrane protein